MAHAALRGERIGKRPDLRGFPAQEYTLHAFVMVQMGMHRGNRQVVMVVLQ